MTGVFPAEAFAPFRMSGATRIVANVVGGMAGAVIARGEGSIVESCENSSFR